LADTGSAELTKNPDALIRALGKIECKAFVIENPVEPGRRPVLHEWKRCAAMPERRGSHPRLDRLRLIASPAELAASPPHA